METNSINELIAIIFIGVTVLAIGRALYSFFSGLREGYKKSNLKIANRNMDEQVDKKKESSVKQSISIAQKANKHRIFISYRRTDSADVTGRIYDRLVHKFGKDNVFKDVDSIPLGVDFRKYLENIIGNSDIFLVVIGPDWEGRIDSKTRRLGLLNDFVTVELESALKRDVPVIPVLVRGAQMPREDELPEKINDIAYRNGAFVRPDPDFHKDVDRLISSIEKQLSKVH